VTVLSQQECFQPPLGRWLTDALSRTSPSRVSPCEGLKSKLSLIKGAMYCKAGVQCTNPEIYGDIKRGRRLAPSKGIVCPRCQGKCCNEACLEKHKCKQRARPSSSVQGMRAVQHARWQGLDPSMGFDPTGGLLDPNMALALARAGQGGLLLPQGTQQHCMRTLQAFCRPVFACQLHSECLFSHTPGRSHSYRSLAALWDWCWDVAVTGAITLRYVPVMQEYCSKASLSGNDGCCCLHPCFCTSL
jgi:hypothetical protein